MKKKKGILLYRDNDALRYAKRNSKELFKVMEDLLTIAEAYVKVNVVTDYVRFFDNPMSYMIKAYADIWNENILIASQIDVSQVQSLKERFDKLYSSLEEWNSQPTITKTTMSSGINPKNFDLYCKPEKEFEYRVMLNFIEATKSFEEAFNTQSRKQITRFTDSLLDNNLRPKYEMFVQFVDNR